MSPESSTTGARGPRLTVLAILADRASRALFPKVVRDPLHITDDLHEGLSLAEQHPPDVAFVEIGMGEGAGLALVHHLKAVVPHVTVFALASRSALEAAANAVALGGAGLIIMPVGGDEILSAIDGVRTKLADKALRADLERASRAYAQAAGWMAHVAGLAAAPSRAAAAEQLVEVLLEATGSAGAAVYLVAGERPTELTRAVATPALDRSPPLGMEPEILEYAHNERLLAIPLTVGPIRAGLLLLSQSSDLDRSGDGAVRGGAATPRLDGVIKLLATQAACAFALLGERERTGGAAIKDPSSSAYSFAYYVDVAGREIDKARRYGRRFAIAIAAFEASAGGRPPPMGHAEMADQLLKAARDTDVLAHVDEHEFHILMPETDGLGAHAARRRVLARIAERLGKAVPTGLLVGVATFPHDGPDLSQLLRVARRRAEATRSSLVRRLGAEHTGLIDLVDAFGWELEIPAAEAVFAARPLELPMSDLAALGGMVVADALRGGATLLVVAQNDKLGLSSAVRAALGPPRDNVTVHAVDVRGVVPGDGIEALAVLAEHGAYAILGRNEKGLVRGLHTADPLLVDTLAERLGRAAGLRLFT